RVTGRSSCGTAWATGFSTEERACPRSGFEDDLDSAVFLALEELVGARRVVERHAVSHDERGVDAALFDELQQRGDVAVHVGLAHSQRQALGEGRADRQ